MRENPSQPGAPAITNHSTAAEKILLFRSLFRGREDVYPRRFENQRTGQAGYAPACAHEWVRGICEKPRIKCADCAHRAFLAVTDEVILWHLSGKDSHGKDFVAGVYPMLADESCFFLAMDFDKESWRSDVQAVMATCHRLDIPAALERSRSGNGGHVWLFFSQAIPATIARKLGSHILTETMEQRPEIGLASYDRLFPNQDTLPKGGFGNLIALPLQKAARSLGHSMFVDSGLNPWPDQWAFLSGMQRLPRERVESIVRDAEHRGRVTGVRFALDEEDTEAQPWNSPPSRKQRVAPITAPLPGGIDIVLGGGHKKLTGNIDVALIQSLCHKGVVDDRVADYGHLIVDECHHLSAHRFELVARRAKARYVCGLSATVTRKDGHHPIIFMQCGPVRHRVDAKQQAENRPFSHHVIVRPTGFRTLVEPNPDRRVEYQNLCAELMRCTRRNEMIRDEVIAAVREGRSPLVLTERTEHVETLAGLLRPHVAHLVVLQGGMGRKSLRQAMAQLASLPESEARVVLATGKFVGEGFDDPRLDTLFLTMPVSWRGVIAQYAGRLHRLHDGKRKVCIHDYADLDIPMLSHMFDKRCAGYEAVGYTILLPASALPGWPNEVPLPIDPAWKNDYAASVRRLIRDGVDAPLAGLFVVASQPASDDQRARSAAEAFLFERLQTLADTTGLFRLNAKLPIPFDNWSEMEVDLYCDRFKLAIEIDGPQHFTEPASYRRDRRKDALLQENGILVLRFLAGDLAMCLDSTLDSIQRALAHLRKKHTCPGSSTPPVLPH